MNDMAEAIQVLARPGRRQRGRRVLRLCFGAFAVASLVMIGLLGGAYLHFSNGQNSDFLRQRVLSAVAEIAGPNAVIALDHAGLSFESAEPLFSVANLDIRDPVSGLGVKVGQIDLAMTPGSLLRLAPDPTRLAISALDIELPASDQSKDAVQLIQSALGGIAGLARMIASVPHLQSVDIAGFSLARLTVNGGREAIGETIAMAARREEDQIRVELRRAQPAGEPASAARPLALTVSVKRDNQGDKAFSLRSDVGALGGLADLLGYPLSVIDPALRLEADLDAGVSAAGKQGPVTAEFRLGGGKLDFTPYGVPALVLDEFVLALSGEAGSTRILLPRLYIRSQQSALEASGSLDIEGVFKQLRLESRNPVIKPLQEGEAPISFDQVTLDARIARDFSAFIVERLVVTDGAGQAQASGLFSRLDGGAIESQVQARDLDIRKALRLWPVFTAPELRMWVIARMHSGRLAHLDLRTALAGQALKDAWAQKPIPDEAVDARYRLENVEMTPVANAPAIRAATIIGKGTGRTSSLLLERGEIEGMPGKPVSLAGASFAVADVSQRPPLLEMKIPLAGQLDAVAAVLSSPGLRGATRIPPEIARGSGQVEGQVSASLRLVRQPTEADLKIDARGDLRGVAISAIAPGENLENGQFKLVASGGAVSIRGEARLNGLPAQIEFRSEGQNAPVATIKAVLDEAQRQRRGIDLRPVVSGPVGATVTLEFDRTAPVDVSVALDLTQTRVEGLFPGQIKRPGQAAKASFDYAARGERILLDDVTLDLAGVSAQGKIEFGKDNQLVKAEFSALRLSPGDNVRATLERQRGVARLNLRGNSFDIRPFLRGVQSGKVDDSKAPDLDIDIQTTVLVGFGGELISAAELGLQRRGGRMSRIQVKGRFGGEPVLVETLDGLPREDLLMRVTSGDGGALIRFLDLYSKAYGGRLAADIRITKAGQSGLVQMRDFSVRGEPLLARYGTEAGATRTPSQRGSASPSRDAVSFTKMRAEFARRPGRIDLTEAVMWGDQVGGTLEGVLDYGADRVDLKGALVPAYALNNLFAQVPLLGPIFGGSQYEGLFALPFVIQGRASAPVLRTNALSVIAPGFLRKLFEVQREGAPSR